MKHISHISVTFLLAVLGFAFHYIPTGNEYAYLAVIESLALLQLLFAWNQKTQRFPWPQAYALFALYLYRLVSMAQTETSMLWALRAMQIENPVLDVFFYTVGLVALHPSAYQWIRDGIESIDVPTRQHLWLYTTIGLAAALLLFYLFPSNHITRDGADWVKRAMNPVWHLYLREPLTIGIHRAGYNIASDWLGWTSREVLVWVSILSGVWCLFWFGCRIRISLHDPFRQILAFGLFFASGGLIVLFFGHLEVYPVLVAGWLPLFYFSQRYLNGTGAILPVAVALSIAFWLHLSTGWLFPAFVVLPFLCNNFRKGCFELLKASGFFIVLQCLFWYGLILYGYEGNISTFMARLHETFFVGLDRAMFLPSSLWFHPYRLYDLINQYFYLSVPCMFLLPVGLVAAFTRRNSIVLFYGIAAASYFLYTFFWNPDRGLPEDWDLFSPWVCLLVLFLSQSILGSKTEEHPYTELVYLIVMGTLPFAAAQVYFHHTVPMILQQF